jgi:hypothetical protein
MRRLISFIGLGLLAWVYVPSAEAQNSNTQPFSFPAWQYNIVSPADNKSYSGYMVGGNPYFHGHRTTTVTVALVPVILRYSNGVTVDPTVPDGCSPGKGSALDNVRSSPLFQGAAFTVNGVDMGTTQYLDAFQRANFWTVLSPAADAYHTMLNLNVIPAVTLDVSSANGTVTLSGSCPLPKVDNQFWGTYLTSTLIPGLAGQGVGPSSVVVILTENMATCTNACTTIVAEGFHGAYKTTGGLTQTYVWAANGSVINIGHELGEWLNDPGTNNLTPAWGHVGQLPSFCSTILETADPLSGKTVPSVFINNVAYAPQELAFFSWFFRQTPSIAAGGKYSNGGTFVTTDGPVCQ